MAFCHEIHWRQGQATDGGCCETMAARARWVDAAVSHARIGAMWRVALTLLLVSHLAGVFLLGDGGATSTATRIVAVSLGMDMHDCCCGDSCACDHGQPDDPDSGCPSDCNPKMAAPSSSSLQTEASSELAAPPAAALPAPSSPLPAITEFSLPPPQHVPITA